MYWPVAVLSKWLFYTVTYVPKLQIQHVFLRCVLDCILVGIIYSGLRWIIYTSRNPWGKKKETRGFCFCFFPPWTLPAFHSRQSCVYSSLASCLLFLSFSEGQFLGCLLRGWDLDLPGFSLGPAWDLLWGTSPFPWILLLPFAMKLRYPLLHFHGGGSELTEIHSRAKCFHSNLACVHLNRICKKSNIWRAL